MTDLGRRRRMAALLLAATCLASPAALADGAGHGEILWDQFGIPHIYAPDLLSVVRGLGYAER